MTWYQILALCTSTAVVAVVSYLSKLGTRITVLEAIVDEKRKDITGIIAGQTNHDGRILVLERVATDLSTLPKMLQQMSTLSARMEVVIENQDRRIKFIEDHLLNKS